MKRIIILLVISFFVVGCVFAFIIFNYNKQIDAEQIQHQKEIERLKQEQKLLDTQFYSQQQTRQQQQINAQKQELHRDRDRDGLTYEQELRSGTSDDNADTDGDYIRDSEDKHPAGGGEIYKYTIPWTHNGRSFTTQFGIAEDQLWYYKNKERKSATDTRYVTPYDPVIQTIAKDISDASVSIKESCKYCLAVDFVESMNYESDIDYNFNIEYPKYPIETIVDKRGDCEDTAFLMASILKALDIDTILLLYSDHMAVGFASGNCPGDDYSYKGRKYCFLETTSEPDTYYYSIPQEYRDAPPTFIELN